uniref:7-dehydrocholesterol reductase n=1 Tax=Setaria digitata TaxID=48799 RepID=A0A915PNY8_9BILA
MLRNNRRSSLVGSQHSISSRRSSCSLKDTERIQIAEAQKKRKLPPQLLISVLCGAPPLLFLHIYVANNCDASFLQFLQILWSDNNVLHQILPSPFTSVAWKILIFITLLQLIFYLVLPKDIVTVVNSMGEREKHSVNSFQSCLLVILLFIFGSALGFYKASIIYIHWVETLSLLNMISVIMVLLLYIGRRDKDDNSSDIINGLFFGTDLAPMIYSVDLKHFITYRIARTLWPLYIISSIYYNHSFYGGINNSLLSCAILQLVYIGKTHWYEHFQYSQLDAQNKKAGFSYIWGTLVLYPAFYATPITVLAQRKIALPLPVSAALLFIGIIAVYVTADIDQQRVQFRLANGNMKVWGEDPFFITAKYRRKNGEIAANLLLGSGWWGLCRHPNYFSEWLTFVCWTILQGSHTFFTCLPLFFLTCYLYLRLKHDELRCLAKYGPYWLQYRNRVRYLLIPSLF